MADYKPRPNDIWYSEFELAVAYLEREKIENERKNNCGTDFSSGGFIRHLAGIERTEQSLAADNYNDGRFDCDSRKDHGTIAGPESSEQSNPTRPGSQASGERQ